MMKLIVGLSGASGIIYGIRLLEVGKELGIETHLVMTRTAEEMIAIETCFQADEVRRLASRVHESMDMTSPLASGSFRHEGMIIIPCSMKTVSGIACGFADNLLLRASDCTLKEKRPLILVPRETPFNQVHLKNMLTLSSAGVMILPASPGFYHRPETIDDLVNHIVGKVLDMLRIDHQLYKRWQGYPQGQ
jgi:4-hydroxy-3-polyprenylbenzoate decarboxylase